MFPIYLQKVTKVKGKTKTVSVRAKAIDKVLIHGKSYVVAKDSMKVGDDVVVIRPGTKIDIKKADKWLSFIHNGNVRISKKCGVTSHGVVIPNKEATRIIKKSFVLNCKTGNIRDVNREDLDASFFATRRLTHKQIELINNYTADIEYYTNKINEILDEE